MKISSFTISEQCSITFFEAADFDSVSVTLVSQIGSSQLEWPSGSVHLLEHVLYRNVSRTCSALAWTDKEYMWLNAKVLVSDWASFENAFFSLFDPQSFTEKLLEQEKRTVIAENRFQDQSQHRVFYQRWNRTVFEEERFARSTIGKSSEVELLTYPDMQKVHLGFCQSSHHLFVFGKSEHFQTQLCEKLKKQFTSQNTNKKTGIIENPKNSTNSTDRVPILQKKFGGDSHVAFGWRIEADQLLLLENRICFELLELLLIRGDHSVLTHILSRKFGAIYNPQNLSVYYRDRGVIGVGFFIVDDIWQKAWPELESGYAALCEDPWKGISFAELKHIWLCRTISKIENLGDFSPWAASHQWLFNRPQAELHTELRSLLEENLSKVSKKLIAAQLSQIVAPSMLRKVQM